MHVKSAYILSLVRVCNSPTVISAVNCTFSDEAAHMRRLFGNMCILNISDDRFSLDALHLKILAYTTPLRRFFTLLLYKPRNHSDRDRTTTESPSSCWGRLKGC